MTPTIALTNRSTLFTDQQIAGLVEPLQTQISEHVAPIWGVDAKVIFSGKQKPPAGAWELVHVDDPDQAGAFGYHELKTKTPWGVVFAKIAQTDGEKWSLTTSHEALEMLCDPFIMSSIVKARKVYGLEICDPVEDAAFAYKIGDAWVSDFITPAWFGAPTGAPYDFKRHCKKPMQVLKGGFIPTQNMRLGRVANWVVSLHNGRAMADSSIPFLSRRWRRIRGLL